MVNLDPKDPIEVSYEAESPFEDIPTYYKNPELLRYSVEALGGDVGGCLRHYFHLPIQWGRNGKAPDYFVLVGGLLLP